VTAIEALADTEFCYLITRGRRSGRPHRIEIWFVADEDAVYVLSNGANADWYRNIVADENVALEVAGERRDTAARTIDRADPVNAVVRPAMIAKYQPGYPQEDLRSWGQTAWLVRIDWPA
jgi:deazaflavin-dependent oxidoreductase (nitroreductase family)